jgi:transposase-like protein
VHFVVRNALASVPTGRAEMVAAAIRTIFAQPDAEHVRSQLEVIVGMVGRQFPKVEAMLRQAGDELTAPSRIYRIPGPYCAADVRVGSRASLCELSVGLHLPHL